MKIPLSIKSLQRIFNSFCKFWFVSLRAKAKQSFSRLLRPDGLARTRNLKIFNLIMISLSFTSPLMAQDKLVWERISSGLSESSIQKILPAEDRLLAATQQALYQKSPQNFLFINLTSWPVSARGIHDVQIGEDNTVYAATDQGVFEYSINHHQFKEIFTSSDQEENRCLSILSDDEETFLGTAKGIFIKNHEEQHWQKLNGELSRILVRRMEQDERFVWAASDHDVFEIRKSDLTTKKIFSSGFHQENDQVNEEVREEDHSANNILAFTHQKELGYLFVATGRSIYRSKDQGETWEALPSVELPLNEITSMLVSTAHTDPENHLLYSIYIGTRKGVYVFQHERWQPIYQGMEALQVNDLAFVEDTLTAATENGVYRLKRETTHQLANTQRVEMVKASEPTIQHVHDMAVHYAEVSPDKILKWRALAQKRAWYPKLTISADGGQDRTISDSVYGSSSGGGQQFVGPDDKSYGNDLGWDVSMSWDLADVIWSDAQTSIDSRAKLMVELRDDILDQVTRLYFERRRVQMELTASGLDEFMRLDKKMRIEELTALIDALTGGEFSRSIKKENDLM